MDNIIIFSARVAKDLIRKGFRVSDIQPDKALAIKTIFFFSNTEELRGYLNKEHNIQIEL